MKTMENKILINKNNIIIMEWHGEVVLYSYNSLIAIYDKTNKKLKLTNLWNYSQTTLKHFKQFINDYTPFCYNTKAQFEKVILNNKSIILN